MDRQEAPDRNEKDQSCSDDDRCILCDVTIEHADHDVFFATGRCRFCHEALESEAASRR
jgi:hypothetical protein